MNNLKKYPKIWHLPWSRSFDTHDRVFSPEQVKDLFYGKEVVVTEKLDGENTNMYSDYIHARSLDSAHHPSRALVKSIHSGIKFLIPEGWRVCGENVYAKHSIGYNELTSSFFIFGIYNQLNACLNWELTEQFAKNSIELPTVPVLYKGIFEIDVIQKLFTGKSVFGNSEQEGYVIRLSGDIPWEQHTNSFAKFVRPHHVQTAKNWLTQPMIKNKGNF
ncbi:MAG TPA: RNA ligase family protein [Bacteroidales bacterium]|nr:RNA ligase family protein [Bacteroidales bacterium]